MRAFGAAIFMTGGEQSVLIELFCVKHIIQNSPFIRVLNQTQKYSGEKKHVK